MTVHMSIPNPMPDPDSPRWPSWPLGIIDDPGTDGTDYAHPAWWRGHDQTTFAFCQLVIEILEGRDAGHGFGHQPWEGVRRRLLSLMKELKELKRTKIEPEL